MSSADGRCHVCDLCCVGRKRSEIGWDARVALSVYGSFSSRAYLNSQRLR